ncbi:MAG TPA: flagellar protein FlbB [Spirochaetia bacterium]|nr:flagellar protein FlbB [Spirochaetales bacterium]HPD79693.1 flagellar protein FlbB [Spirochaetales bacterium]HQK33321.1 flagellar protein FlbB [Spirochaetales bacterium]HRS65106.1 flagellar protein FlbB [Spirochaetia bacterium]HRV27727.1 flagellar protein FlbB [Spirochaetia bacterium]
MPGYRKQRVGTRVLAMILLIIVVLILGFIWLDFLGFIDLKNFMSPVFRLLNIPVRTGKSIPVTVPALLDEERFAKQFEALELQKQQLAETERVLKEKENMLLAREQELNDKDKKLQEQQISLNNQFKAYENRKANIEQNARYLTGMPPKEAVNILLSMDDELVIDILRMVDALAASSGENSIVPYWMSLMPAERSAAIQRKMAIKSESE